MQIVGFLMRRLIYLETITLALLIVTSPLPTLSRLPVKLMEHEIKVTFATTCLHNGIIRALVAFILLCAESQLGSGADAPQTELESRRNYGAIERSVVMIMF